MRLPTICSLIASAYLALMIPGHLEDGNTIHGGLLVERQSVPTSGGVPLINTVNIWRARYKLPSLTWDTTLAGYATDAGRGATCSESRRHAIRGDTRARVTKPWNRDEHEELESARRNAFWAHIQWRLVVLEIEGGFD